MGIEEWRGEESRQDILIPLNKWMSRDSKGHPVQFDLYDGKTGRWRMSIQQNEWNQIWAAIDRSTRSYNTARDRLSAEHSERTGQAVTFETFDARDSDQDPTKKLK